ncbi:TIR domain-containing protein [Chloroflexota bacterium]
MSYNIFISYKRGEADDFAHYLHEQLNAEGHNVFLDKKDILTGEKWEHVVEQALDSADVLIGIVTENSAASHEVRSEWGHALKHNKRIFFVTMNEDSEVPYRYEAFQRINLVNHDKNEAVLLLKSALQRTTITIPDAEFAPDIRERDVGEVSKSRDEAREDLLEKVQQAWIGGVLEKSLHGDSGIALGWGEHDSHKNQSEGLQQPGAIYKHGDLGDFALPADAKISDIFFESGRNLLILGDPGSGKTITMLQLVKDLLNQAKEDIQRPLPVVLSLTTWTNHGGAISDWIVDELYAQYEVQDDDAIKWLNGPSIVCMLDGLDEVEIDQRSECVEQINKFLVEFPRPGLVVCSRIIDYEELNKDLRCKSAIVLKDLTQQQINKYIETQQLEGLREILEHDEIFQEMAQSPFLLNTMSYAYRDVDSSRVPAFNTKEERLEHLFSRYIHDRLTDHEDDYASEKTQHYLTYLAQQMLERKQSQFYIERMQPDWLPEARQNTYGLLMHVITVLIVGLSLGGASGLTLGLAISDPGIAIIASLLFTISWVFTAWFVIDRIFGLVGGLIIGLVWGIVFGITAFITGGWVTASLCFAIGFLSNGSFFAQIGGRLSQLRQMSDTSSITLIERVRTNRKKVFSGILFFSIGALPIGIMWYLVMRPVVNQEIAIAFAISGWLMFAATMGVAFGQVSDDTKTTIRPNQGIWNSARNSWHLMRRIVLYCFFLYFVTLGFLGFYTGQLTEYLLKAVLAGGAFGIGFGAVAALLFGGFAAIQHVLLRQMLKRKKVIPHNYAHFLDYAAKRALMHKIGGGYIFIHRELLEFFASRKTTIQPNTD